MRFVLFWWFVCWSGILISAGLGLMLCIDGFVEFEVIVLVLLLTIVDVVFYGWFMLLGACWIFLVLALWCCRGMHFCVILLGLGLFN